MTLVDLTPYLPRPYKLKTVSAMAATTFDATGAVHFDLQKGAVKAGSDHEPVLLLPCAALDDLALSAPAEAEVLARALGTAIGKRAAARLGHARDASVEAFVAQLAGQCAVAGVGALSVERWGRALVLVLDDSRLAGPLLAPLIAAALEAALGKPVACGLLFRDARTARILAASEGAIKRTLDAIAGGAAWGEALTRLQAGAS
jgi:hypothetical protein